MLLLEIPAEMTVIVQSHGVDHFLQIQRCLREHSFGLPHSYLAQILNRRLGGLGLEQVSEVPVRESYDPSQSRHRETMLTAGFHEIDSHFHSSVHSDPFIAGTAWKREKSSHDKRNRRELSQSCSKIRTIDVHRVGFECDREAFQNALETPGRRCPPCLAMPFGWRLSDCGC